MTMNDMDSYLRNRGFCVNRVYLPHLKKYRFSIEKCGYNKNYFIDYPRRDCDKESNLRYMVDDMNKCIEVKRMSEAPCGLTGNLTDGYRYTPDNLSIEMSIPKLECAADVETTTNLIIKRGSNMKYEAPIDIKDVIFNEPATIVYWTDGTKTVVKVVNEEFDKEKGLAMAIAKKHFGNKGNYFNHIKKWVN